METTRCWWILCFPNTKTFVGPWKTTVILVEDAKRFDTQAEASHYADEFKCLLDDLPYPVSVVMTSKYNLERDS